MKYFFSILFLFCLIEISYSEKVIYNNSNGNIEIYESNYAYVPVNDQCIDQYIPCKPVINGSYGTYYYNWTNYGFGYVSNLYVNGNTNLGVITNINEAGYFNQIVIDEQINWANYRYYSLSNPSNYINVSQGSNLFYSRSNPSNYVGSNIISGLASTNWVLNINMVTNVTWNQGNSNNVYISNKNLNVIIKTNYATIGINNTLSLPKSTFAPDDPTEGDLYYNTLDNTIKYYNGYAWRTIRMW